MNTDDLFSFIYPWQTSKWQQVMAMYQQNRLPHALLLHGPRGMGKVQFAKNLANYLLCTQQQSQPLAMPCGKCRGCILFHANNHPDFIEISPLEKSKVIKIEQVRELIKTTNQTSQRGGYQIVIIHPMEAMHHSAANALLKTLEEPTGNIIFLLVCEQFGSLPLTIVSRCQRMVLTNENIEASQQWLATQVHKDGAELLPNSKDLLLLLKLAHFAPLQALDFAKNNYLSLRNELLYHLLQIKNELINPIIKAEEYIKLDFQLVLHTFTILLTDLFRIKLGVVEPFILNEDRLNELQKLANTYSLAGLHEISQRLRDIHQDMLSGHNPNLQLLYEDLLLTWDRV